MQVRMLALYGLDRRPNLVLLLLCALCLSLQGCGRAPDPPAAADADSVAAAAPLLGYERVEWPTEPTGVAGFSVGPWNFIQVSGVAVTPQGNVLVLHRGAHPLKEFRSDGMFVRALNAGEISEGKVGFIPQANWTPDRSRYSAVYGPAGCTSCGAHSVRIDPAGNVWVVDATGHVVYKRDPGGRELMRLGTQGVAGVGANTFNLPTDVAFGADGAIYVTDGYGNARVVKYASDGTYLLEWGTRGQGPGQFGLPHNVVTDKQGRVYVTDRDNQRVQVFDANGTFLSQWRDTGGVSGLGITDDQQIWTGPVLRDLDGKVLGRLPDATGGHAVAIGSSGEVYIAQLSGVAQKFVRR